MTMQALIVATLAVYAVAFMIARLDGPFGVFTWLREHIDPAQNTWLGRGWNCPVCLSFWIGAIVSMIIGASWIEWLAMIGAIVMINKWVMR